MGPHLSASSTHALTTPAYVPSNSPARYEDSDSEEMEEKDLMQHLQHLPAAGLPGSACRRGSRSGSGAAQQLAPAAAAAGAAGTGSSEAAGACGTAAGASQQPQRQQQLARPCPSTSRQQAEAPLRRRLRSASARPVLPAATSSRGQKKRDRPGACAATAAQAGPNTVPAGSAGSLGERHASPAEAAADATVSRGQKRARGEPAEGARIQPSSATGEGERVASPAAQHMAAAVNAAGVAADTQRGGSGRNRSSPAHTSSAPLPAPPAGQARPSRVGGLLQALMRRGLDAAPMPAPSIASASPRVAQQGDAPAVTVPAAAQPVLAAAVPGGPAAGQVSLQEGTGCMPDAAQAAEDGVAGAPSNAGAAPAAAEPEAASVALAGLAAPAAAPVEPAVVKSAREAGPVSSAPGQPPKRQMTSSAAQELEAAAGAAPAGATMGAEQPAEEPGRQLVGAADAAQQATASAGPPSPGHATTSSSTEINQRRQGSGQGPARSAVAAASGDVGLQAAVHTPQDAVPAEASTASAAAPPVQLRGSQAAGGFKQRPAPFSAGPARSLVQPVRVPAAAQHPLFSSSMSMPGSRPGAPAPAPSWYAPHPYPTPQTQPRAPHYAAPAHPAGTLSLPPGPAASARAVPETALYSSAACASWAAPSGQGCAMGQPLPAGPWTPAVPAPGWGP